MKVNSNSIKSKINWVCYDCGHETMRLPDNKGKRPFTVSTYHGGTCDVCKQNKPVTETRDFMFPVFEIKDV